MADPKVKIIVTAEDQASATLGTVTGSMSGMGTALLGLQMGVMNLTNGLMQMTSMASDFAHTSVDTFAQFDTAMVNAQSITKGTNAELAEMEELAKTIGRDMPVMAQDAANGMYQLASAGKSANDIMEITPQIMKLSIATAADFATTAKLVTAVQDSWGLSNREVNQTTDILMNTVKSFKTDLPDLAITMQYVATTAANLGVSVSSTAMAIGMLRQRGLEASSAGTGLRMMFQKLAASTNAIEGPLVIVAENLVTAADGSLDFQATMSNLNRELSNYDPIEKQAFLTAAFGARAATAASILIDEADAMADLDAQMQESGSVTETYGKQIESAGNQITIMKGKMAELEIEIGEKMLPAELKYLELQERKLDLLNKMPESLVEYGGATAMVGEDVGKTVTPILLFVVALGSLVPAIAAVKVIAAGLVGVLTTFILPIVLIIALLALSVAFFHHLSKGMNDWGKVILMLINPLFLIYKLLTDTTDTLQAFSNAWDSYITDIESIYNILVGVSGSIDDFFSGLLDDAYTWGEDFVNEFIAGIVDMLGLSGPSIEDAVGGIAGFFGGSPPEFGPLHQAMIEGGPEFIKGYLGNMAGAIPAGGGGDTYVTISPSFNNTFEGTAGGLKESSEQQFEYTIQRLKEEVEL